MTTLTVETKARQEWMGLLARATPARLAELMPDLPEHALLRGPEVGAVMVQGRTGGTGQPFNLGEMTVTRCSLRLVTGQVGHAHVQGRDKGHALRAAVVDALMLGDQADGVRAQVLTPLQAEETARRNLRASKAAATKVEFFHAGQGRRQMNPLALQGGFADAPIASARAFRAALEAMARPGTIWDVAWALRRPAPLSVAAGCSGADAV